MQPNDLIKDIIYGNFPIIAGEKELLKDILHIEGIALTEEVNANNWQIKEEEFESIAKSLTNDKPTLRINHGDKVYDMVGSVVEGIYDKEHKAVRFKGEVVEPRLFRRIMSGIVKNVSIRGSAQDIVCSVCGKRSKPFKLCKCEGSHDVVKGTRIKEISFIVDPAYNSTLIKPLGFIASIEKNLKDLEDKGEVEMSEKKDVKTATEEKSLVAEEKKEVKEKVGDKKEVKEETTVKPMGTDAIALIADKMESIMKQVKEELSKLDTRLGKLEEYKVAPPETHEQKVEEKKKDEDDEKKDTDEEEDDEKKDEDDEKKDVKAKSMGGKVNVELTGETDAPQVTDEIMTRVTNEIKAGAKRIYPDWDIKD